MINEDMPFPSEQLAGTEPSKPLPILNRSNPIDAFGAEIITTRVKEILEHRDERILLGKLSQDELLEFANSKPSQEVKNKARDIAGYDPASKMPAKIEKYAQLLAYLEFISLDYYHADKEIVGYWIRQYRSCVSEKKDYIIDNHKEAHEKLEEHKACTEKELATWQKNYIYSYLLVKVFQCALEIDSYLAEQVKKDNDSLARVESADSWFLGMSHLFGSETAVLLGSNSHSNSNVKVYISAAVIASILGLSLGLGLGLGLQ